MTADHGEGICTVNKPGPNKELFTDEMRPNEQTLPNLSAIPSNDGGFVIDRVSKVINTEKLAAH